MDPNACLQRLADARTHRARIEAAQDLAVWLDRGGFAPDWNKSPQGLRSFICYLATSYPGAEERYKAKGLLP